MFRSCKSCGSGKGSELDQRTSYSMPSHLVSVLKKLDSMEEFHRLPKAQKLERAQELTDSTKLWRLYFSGVVLDPARDHIEAGIGVGIYPGEASSGARVPIKLLLQPIVGSGQYGLQGQVTSMLLRNYGSLHASLVVGDAVVLEWNTASLVIPTGKPIPCTSAPDSSAENEASGVPYPVSFSNDILEQEFEATIAKKVHVDKIINVLVKYNKSNFFHPIIRNCQKFIADILNELDYPLHQKLVGNLIPYYEKLKKSQKKSKTFDTHAELDDAVRDCLQRDMPTATMEYLLVRYFLFHMTSLTDCERPERWSCEHRDCLMPRLEQRINLEDTLAYQQLH